jgi:SAM-dependent methyltransferase
LDEAVLDVGSGTGSLVLHLSRYGFTRLHGIDPFLDENIDYPNGIRVTKQSIDAVVGTHRVAIFNHSLEHTVDPLDQLRHARRLLHPGGRVVVRVPAVGGSWDRHGVAFVGLEEAPRHIFVPTLQGIKALADRAGLRFERAIHDGSAHHVLVSDRRASEGMVKRAESRWKPGRFSRVQANIRARRQNVGGRGDTMTVLLRLK